LTIHKVIIENEISVFRISTKQDRKEKGEKEKRKEGRGERKVVICA